MVQVISVAGLTLPIGPIAFLLSFLVGSELASRSLVKVAPVPDREQWKDAMSSAMLWALLAGVLTARLAYVVRFSELYFSSPQLVLSPRPGTLMLLPGLLGGGAVLFFIMSRKSIPLSSLADALAIGFLGALAVYHVGLLLTGGGYGLPTELPWGIDIWGTSRHPVQLYDALAVTGILVFLWVRLPSSQPGQVFWYFVTFYSVSILILTGFHATSATWIQGIRITQVVALASLLMGLYVLSFYARQSQDRMDVLTSEKAEPA